MIRSLKRKLVLVTPILLVQSQMDSRVEAFAAVSVAVAGQIMSMQEGEDPWPTSDAISSADAPYHAFEAVDAIQDIRDIVSDYKAVSLSQSLLMDPINQVVIASHIADIVVDIVNRMFHKNISCKFAQVIVRGVSLGTIVCTSEDLFEHPGQLLVQVVLLIAATNNLTDARRFSCKDAAQSVHGLIPVQ